MMIFFIKGFRTIIFIFIVTDRRIKDNTRKPTTACLPYIKGISERIQKIM